MYWQLFTTLVVCDMLLVDSRRLWRRAEGHCRRRCCLTLTLPQRTSSPLEHTQHPVLPEDENMHGWLMIRQLIPWESVYFKWFTRR